MSSFECLQNLRLEMTKINFLNLLNYAKIESTENNTQHVRNQLQERKFDGVIKFKCYFNQV